ncbi:formylglycine-generating enzyme family protein [Nostoc sphaeroides]|uniref:Sulfatase-modifying factor enzyme 1 n=1 Tax=Nostoc sphaeroides CCNUC1 TaxID=2653204 RepID=A0A5P8WI36_9NOSO|nr:formylglycine-generating enzyme family protein [Nostoc sphaeroides]QFS52260.1 Sulfatase-modifying factor enzyme 1 [Nostoc sphaeroides CCNUC1]
MIGSTSPEKDLKLQAAKERIDAWGNSVRVTSGHLEFAFHAAFPLALTTDLLYRLRDYLITEFKLQIPWIAVTDLLLSGFCYEVDQELYEIDITVREELLSRLPKERLKQLSKFLLKYIELQINHTDSNLIQAQKWTALSYVEPTEAAKQITEKIAKMLTQRHKDDWSQIAFLVETLAKPLQDAGFEPLLTLAQSMAQSSRGDYSGAKAQLDNLHNKLGSLPNIAGVTFSFVPVHTFGFNVVTVNTKGEIAKRETKTAQYFTETLSNNVTLEMVSIPGGTFIMGSPSDEAQYNEDDESPQHEVTVSSFFMGKYPVTQAQWRVVAALPQINRELRPDPSEFKGDDLPVEQISWYEAVEFCDRLSKQTNRYYRLPSEAEWEYACRSGTTAPFHFGETITSDLANYSSEGTYGDAPKGKSLSKTTKVSNFKFANAFGLYDMHGNVREWCYDHWHIDYKGAPTDGSAWIDKDGSKNENSRLLRGGSWLSGPRSCRSASRYSFDPGTWYEYVGFRVVVSSART